MRVLLVNPAAPESFWTFRKSCEFSGHKALNPPLGLVTVAALLPCEWDFRLVDLLAQNLSNDHWDWADTVMLSGMIIQRESLLALVQEAKQRGKRVVVGGPYPTSLPNEVLEAGCDFLVRGEGESAIPLFLKALEAGKTRGVIENSDKPEMPDSPIPRFDLINFDDYNTLSVQTSRGCPFDCEFCDIVNLYGRKPRYKTPDQVIAELETIYNLGWRREVFIADDNFIGSKRHARSILEELIPWMKSHGEPFSFWAQSSVNLGQDLELIDLMTEANFATVFVGIESPDEEILQLNRKFQNVRNPLLESIANINANGLDIMASFVIGFDSEKKGAGERIAAFADQAGLPMVMLNVLQALPNTRLWERLKAEGRLLEAGTSGQTSGGRMNFIPSRPESEIASEYLAACDYLYEPSHYLARAYRFFLKMRPTRAVMNGKERTPIPTVEDGPKRRLYLFFRDLYRFLSLCWGQGVRSDYKIQFWRQLFGIWRKNPSRLVKYLKACVLGESLFPLRKMIKDRVGQVDEARPKSRTAS
jgi:radical SAM superfamily enzyme YgiQ (UPF0313 family)